MSSLFDPCAPFISAIVALRPIITLACIVSQITFALHAYLRSARAPLLKLWILARARPSSPAELS
eukprot:3796185-Pleurochrysis_carterae.AAC.1